MAEIVPQRQQVDRPVQHQWRESYRARITPDAEWQRCRLEALRYKWGGYKDGFRIIQRLHIIADKLGLTALAAYRWNRRG